MPASEHVPSPELAALIELTAHPDALRWAHECGWVPGTGHCRNRGCTSECLFRPQREAEARQVVRARRRRRKPELATVPDKPGSLPTGNRNAGCAN